jgi:hypothetical protein
MLIVLCIAGRTSNEDEPQSVPSVSSGTANRELAPFPPLAPLLHGFVQPVKRLYVLYVTPSSPTRLRLPAYFLKDILTPSSLRYGFRLCI